MGFQWLFNGLQRAFNAHYGIIGVWLFYPLADCPPDGLSSMDGPLFGLSTVRITHRNVLSPAWKHHPTDSPLVVKPLVHLGQH